MRVGFYVGDLTLDSGGTAPYTRRLNEILSRNKFRPEIEYSTIRIPSRGLARCSFRCRMGMQRFLDSYAMLTRPGPPEKRLPRVRAFGWPRGIDLLHVPFQSPPTFEHPFICTMHDVQELHFPEYFSPSEREWRASNYRKAIEYALKVVVSFEHVKRDIVRYFSCDHDKVVVMPLPIQECQLNTPSHSQSQQFSGKYQNFGRYFLYPAQTWPHKNHIRLLEAFDRVMSSEHEPIHLVCTGKQNDFFEVIRGRLRDLRHADKIHFVGVVSDEELRWLYDNCVSVVIPTLYEAGSFPLIEAMSIGVPVVCARTTSLPETIGCSEFVFDPYDVSQIAEKMTLAIHDAAFRDRCIQNGRLRISELVATDIADSFEQMWIDLMPMVKARGRT